MSTVLTFTYGCERQFRYDAPTSGILRIFRASGVPDCSAPLDAIWIIWHLTERNACLAECNGKVAVLGYCLGALMVFLTAVRYRGVDAAVAYHGGDTEKYLGEVDGLNAPF
jgi:hypothetical protein